MADEIIPAFPNLKVAELAFHLVTPSLVHIHGQSQTALLEAIKQDEMGPFYRSLYESTASIVTSARVPQSPRVARAQLESGPLGRRDELLLGSLEEQNRKTIDELDSKIAEAEKNEGETEIAEAVRAKAAYLTRIGDKDKAIEAQKVALQKNAGIGARIDIALTLVRIGLFWSMPDLVKEYIAKAEEFIQKGGDWDRRNRLKVYLAWQSLTIRDFKRASTLLIDALPTFTATELLPLESFVELTLLVSVFAESRTNLREKVLKSSEVASVINDIGPDVASLAKSLVESRYAEFFLALAKIEQEQLAPSRLLSHHKRYYVTELRVKAYAQLLESYQSLTIDSLARAFGVSVEYIDKELVRFIAAGRLNCVVDRVHGIVETNRPSTKSATYEAVVKQGDILLNSVQRLSKVLY